jgi:hypothetical protein
MEEELIKLKTAKLAKEKGFSTNTTGIYEWEQDCEIVPQSVLQKWLREKHNIIVFAKHFYQNWYEWVIQSYEDLDGDRFWDEDINSGNEYSNSTSYEEALEDGILQALKLIKKNANNN